MEQAEVRLVCGQTGNKTDFICNQEGMTEISLPEGTGEICIALKSADCIFQINSMQGYRGFWYDLETSCPGRRLGSGIFLLEAGENQIDVPGFRYETDKIRISYELISVSAEAAEKIVKELERKQRISDDFEQKWHNQVTVYDEKVARVVELEQDKVALGQAIEDLKKERDFWQSQYQTMENSSSWRITAPLRNFNQRIAGFKARSELSERKKAFETRIRETGQEQAEIGDKKVSVITVVNDLDVSGVFALAGMVLLQTYRNLEFLVYDTGTGQDLEAEKIWKWLAGVDTRLRYRKIDKAELSGGKTSDGQKIAGEISPQKLSDQMVRSVATEATGDYAGFIWQGDLLDETALEACVEKIGLTGADFLYTDQAFLNEQTGEKEEPWFKPDFSPDYLRSFDYISHFWLADRKLFAEVSNTGDGVAGDPAAWNYDMVLRLTERAENIVHLPEILYCEKRVRLTEEQLKERNATMQAALEAHLNRQGLYGRAVLIDAVRSLFKIEYQTKDKPLVSILIPNKDHAAELEKCLDSIFIKTTYENYEIIIIENNSGEKATFDYYHELEQNPKVRIIQWEKGFNYSGLNNFGAKEAKGEFLLLLNNDMEIITPDWIEEMLMYAERPDVGAVGAKLYYPDDTVQHAGVIIGLGGVAAHSHKDYKRQEAGYMNRLLVAQNLSAVTAACLLVKKSIYEEAGGMNEEYAVAFNDADFCMKLREAGYLIVFTPFAELYHDESKSRGTENTPEKEERFEGEIQLFKRYWKEILETGDPYYNRNLTTEREDFSIG